MAAQNGRDLLVKVDMDGNGVFEAFAGLPIVLTSRALKAPAAGANYYAAPA